MRSTAIFFHQPIGIFLRVDRFDSQKNQDPSSNFAVWRAVYLDSCVGHALKNALIYAKLLF